MEDKKSLHKKNFYNRCLIFLKGSLLVACIYISYFIYSISEFSFIKGVNNSSKSKETLTIAILHGDAEYNELIVQLPNEVSKQCSEQINVREFEIAEDEKESSGDLERISVTGARVGSFDTDTPNLDLMTALKNIGIKIAKDEASKFAASYSTKFSIDGFYSLKPISSTDNKQWRLNIDKRCIRVLRFFTEENELKVGADVVFNFEYSNSVDAIKLSPIYSKIDFSAAKSISNSIALDIKVSTNWIINNYDSVSSLQNETSILMGRITLNKELIAIKGLNIKNLKSSLISNNLMNSSSWITAPPFPEERIKECIQQAKECYLVAGDLTFNFFEVGEGAKLFSDISTMNFE